MMSKNVTTAQLGNTTSFLITWKFFPLTYSLLFCLMCLFSFTYSRFVIPSDIKVENLFLSGFKWFFFHGTLQIFLSFSSRGFFFAFLFFESTDVLVHELLPRIFKLSVKPVIHRLPFLEGGLFLFGTGALLSTHQIPFSIFKLKLSVIMCG